MKTVKLLFFTAALASLTACTDSERNHPVGSKTDCTTPGYTSESSVTRNTGKPAKAPGTIGGESYNFADSVRR
jgi:hypothetical protein